MIRYDRESNPGGLKPRKLGWTFERPPNVERWKRKRLAFVAQRVLTDARLHKDVIYEDEFNYDKHKGANRQNTRVWVACDEEPPTVVRHQYPSPVSFGIAFTWNEKLPLMPLADIALPQNPEQVPTLRKLKGNAETHREYVFDKILAWRAQKRSRQHMRLLTDNAGGHAKLYREGYLDPSNHIGLGGYEFPDGGFPPSSPDFNCSEYVIHCLKQRVQKRQLQFALLRPDAQPDWLDIVEWAREEWTKVPQAVIRNCIKRGRKNMLGSHEKGGDLGEWATRRLKNCSAIKPYLRAPQRARA